MEDLNSASAAVSNLKESTQVMRRSAMKRSRFLVCLTLGLSTGFVPFAFAGPKDNFATVDIGKVFDE